GDGIRQRGSNFGEMVHVGRRVRNRRGHRFMDRSRHPAVNRHQYGHVPGIRRGGKLVMAVDPGCPQKNTETGGVNGSATPQGRVNSRTLKSCVPLSPVTRSVVPLPSRSEAARDTGILPVRYAPADERFPLPSPWNRETEAPLEIATAASRLPSPS